MAMEEPQGNGSTILMVIAVGLIGFGLGWLVGNNNVTPETGDDAAAAAVADADLDGVGDSDLLPVGDSPIKGNPNAPITVVEFTSMQCPFCARGGATLNELVEKYPEDVRIVFKHFPLAMQQEARPASKAAAAADRQGKFWEMKDALFDRLSDYGDQPMEDLGAELAADLGLDVDQFRQDFNDPEIAAIIDRDMELGGERGVRGTPHFFVNGEVVNGAQPLETFSEVVERQLEVIESLRNDGVAENELYAAAVKQNMDSEPEQPERPERPEPQEDDVEVHMLEIQDYDHVKGASEEDALVTIMEFSSFQCPHCARGASTLSDLLEKYPNEVRVVFKHFPLGFQEHSEPASRASVAAGNQDKFWEMYDLLYENQRSLGEDGIFVRLAEEIGLNMDRFTSDFDADATAQIVKDSQAEGRSAGIRGTPGFLINGIKETGAQPLQVFSNHVDGQIEIAKKIRDDKGLSGNELYAAVVEYNKENAGSGGGEEADSGGDAADLSVGDSFVKGPDDAAVTIYEFSSFQCPFCARAAGTMAEVIEEYEGDVRLVYKNFPLAFQSESEPAARAAVAAGQQDKFWEMYEALYENQRRFGQDGLWEELAQDIGLNMDQFKEDFESDAVAEQVKAEQSEGSSVGVTGTPAFFINGDELSGAQPIERFRQVIDRHLDS